MRLLVSVSVLLAGSGVGYLYHAPLVIWLQRPLGEQLYFTAPAGAFQYILLVSLLVGVLMATPVFIYELVSFVAPALPDPGLLRRRVGRTITAGTLLAVAGMAFAYYVILPVGLHFFASFSLPSLRPLITAGDYLSFAAGCLLTFAVLFQLPLLLDLYDRVKPIPPGTLRRHHTHVIVGSLVVALLLPFTYDPLSQFLIALPIVALYELTAAWLWIKHRKQLRQVGVRDHAPVAEPLPAQSASSGLAEGRAVPRRRRPIQLG